MKIAISKFKTHCLEILDNLNKNHKKIIITKRNIPIAKIESIKASKDSLFGLLKNKAEITGDIITPTEEKWSAENE